MGPLAERPDINAFHFNPWVKGNIVLPSSAGGIFLPREVFFCRGRYFFAAAGLSSGCYQQCRRGEARIFDQVRHREPSGARVRRIQHGR